MNLRRHTPADLQSAPFGQLGHPSAPDNYSRELCLATGLMVAWPRGGVKVGRMPIAYHSHCPSRIPPFPTARSPM